MNIPLPNTTLKMADYYLIVKDFILFPIEA